MSLQIGQQLGSFEITSFIGKGGMGEVYRARDTRLKRDVAIKILPDELSQDTDRISRFQREAESLAALNHPNIAGIHDLQQSGDTRFLILEFVEGDTLADILKTRSALPVDEALQIAKQICEALEAAHERGIIHRDLKPANVKITPEGKVKVLDFGLAKAFAPETSTASLSDSPTLSMTADAGVILGTAAYMSPEQARGTHLDHRTDIFAFGCVLYEMLTGKQAFTGDTISDTIASILKTDPNWKAIPSQASSRVLKLLRRCLQKSPRNRIRHAADLRFELDDLLTQPEPVDDSVPIRRERTPWLAWALFGIAAIASLLLGISQLRQPAQTPLWLSIPAPQNGFGLAPRPAVSPDGRYVAFAAPDSAGQNVVWIRALDSPVARQLPTTEGTSHDGDLFWSPDCRSIGFFANGKLKRIDIDGGSAVPLADAPAPRGGTWNKEGVILFAPVSGEGLYRISSSGDQLMPVTEIDSASGVTRHVLPSFLPDGRHFIYLGVSADPQTAGIYVGVLDAKDTIRLSKTFSKAQYSDGYLLFVRERNLFAQPFDSDELRLSGEPVRVAEGVGWGGAITGDYSFSASANGVLVFWGGSRIPESQLTWVDRTGNPLETVGESGHYIHVSLAPDGKQIAVERYDPLDSTVDVWSIDSVSGLSTRRTSDKGWAGSPVWSADSSRVLFVSFFKRDPLQIYDMGSQRVQSVTTDVPGLKTPMDWSSNDIVMFDHNTPNTAGDIWMLKMSQGVKTESYLQTDHNERHGQVAPDARWIAYMSNESGKDEIYVDSFPKKGGKKIISMEGGVLPKWSRSGTELFYLSPERRTFMAVSLTFDSGGIQAIRRNALFDTPELQPWYDRSQYAVSPNGKRFLINLPLQKQPAAMTVALRWRTTIEQ